jgi:hypothetical protein
MSQSGMTVTLRGQVGEVFGMESQEPERSLKHQTGVMVVDDGGEGRRA